MGRADRGHRLDRSFLPRMAPSRILGRRCYDDARIPSPKFATEVKAPGWPRRLARLGREATRVAGWALAWRLAPASLTPLAASPPGRASRPGHPWVLQRISDSPH